MRLATIESINFAAAEVLTLGGKGVKTAIRKIPTKRNVNVGMHGIMDDEIGDEEHHGGLNRALHCFSVEHYDYFTSIADSDQKLPPRPWVGENLTLKIIQMSRHL